MTVRHYSIGILIGILSGAGAEAQSYTISTIAGNYTAGYSGDNGAATSAQLNFPGGILVAPNGNVYIADTANNVVRMVANGTITTVAGNTTAGYMGDKGPATSAELNSPVGLGMDSSGNLYIADSANQVIRQVSTSGTITTWAGTNVEGYTGDGGPANVAGIALHIGSSPGCDGSGRRNLADHLVGGIRDVEIAG